MPDPDYPATITVEAVYTLPGNDTATTTTWTLQSTTPTRARNTLLTQLVPLEATLWRYTMWPGTSENKPTDENHTTHISLDDIQR